MEFRDVHELVINKLRSVVIRYRLPLSPLRKRAQQSESFFYSKLKTEMRIIRISVNFLKNRIYIFPDSFGLNSSKVII